MMGCQIVFKRDAMGRVAGLCCHKAARFAAAKVGGQGGEKLKPGNREAASGFSFQRFTAFPFAWPASVEGVDPGRLPNRGAGSRPAVCQETPTPRRPCHARHTGRDAHATQKHARHPAGRFRHSRGPVADPFEPVASICFKRPGRPRCPRRVGCMKIPHCMEIFMDLMAAMIERKADIQAVQTALKRSRGVHGPAVFPLVENLGSGRSKLPIRMCTVRNRRTLTWEL